MTKSVSFEIWNKENFAILSNMCILNQYIIIRAIILHSRAIKTSIAIKLNKYFINNAISRVYETICVNFIFPLTVPLLHACLRSSIHSLLDSLLTIYLFMKIFLSRLRCTVIISLKSKLLFLRYLAFFAFISTSKSSLLVIYGVNDLAAVKWNMSICG